MHNLSIIQAINKLRSETNLIHLLNKESYSNKSKKIKSKDISLKDIKNLRLVCNSGKTLTIMIIIKVNKTIIQQ